LGKVASHDATLHAGATLVAAGHANIARWNAVETAYLPASYLNETLILAR
jgi:hypothetical protein